LAVAACALLVLLCLTTFLHHSHLLLPLLHIHAAQARRHHPAATGRGG
jgi:hypothetical protein